MIKWTSVNDFKVLSISTKQSEIKRLLILILINDNNSMNNNDLIIKENNKLLE